ncbi:PREDICTED: CD63 antigen-like isoform X2 [Dinoponera quadriceps]|uniref:CD63 antigen-like isoform X2 n=1 Tax=Dinoponera quadriceps TaxID=609295 RepID=A0A6P3XQC0_DINQU|nr:PREDICTED: CD63 antigen-like isoform X2 [Dinoponera quadriceps]
MKLERLFSVETIFRIRETYGNVPRGTSARVLAVTRGEIFIGKRNDLPRIELSIVTDVWRLERERLVLAFDNEPIGDANRPGVVTGIVFISVGAVILVAYNGYNNFVDSWFFAAPVLMIIVGVIVFLVSFFGCCGAVKENHCMIITFSVLLLLIFALELGAGITGYMMRGEISNMLENRMNSTMRQYEENRDIRNSWDIMQHDLQCCGMNSPADWIQFGSEDNTIPESCCKELPAQGKCDANSIHLFEDGCMMRLKAAIESSALILGGVGVGIAIVQLIGVIFACCLARSIRREYETVETTAH